MTAELYPCRRCLSAEGRTIGVAIGANCPACREKQTEIAQREPSGTVVDLPTWKRLLRYRTNQDGQQVLVSCVDNVTVVLSHDADFRGRFARNELSGETELVEKLPKLDSILPPRRGPIDDYVLTYTRIALNSLLKLSVGADIAAQGIEAAARQRCFNPLKDYLSGVEWDGQQRIGSWLSRYLGAERTAYTDAVGRWWLVSAVARAFRPGCQADHVMVLEGPQGAGKSTALGILGGPWYLGKLPPLRDSVKAAHALSGAWLVEIGEMDAFRGAASSQIKDFLTQSEDRYRPPYARYPVKQRRTCVFAGTTNDARYLRDATGARRFWPVMTGRIDRDALTRDRDQLWAEARIAFEDGATWWPSPEDEALLEVVRNEQEERHEGDEWIAKIAAWLDEPTTINLNQGKGEIGAHKDGVTTGDVMKSALSLSEKDWTREAQTRVGMAMATLGLVAKREQVHGVRVRRYWRK
jgi:predicted P-loop ATPase